VEPGCPTLVERGRCVVHQVQHDRRYNRERPVRHQLYQTPMHRAWRTRVIARDPICVRCHERLSVVANHIVPVEHGGQWTLDNGEGLCRACDNVVKGEERRKRW